MKMYGAKKHKKRKVRSKIPSIILLVVLVIAVSGAAWWFGNVKAPESMQGGGGVLPGQVEEKIGENIEIKDTTRKDGIYNILIIGTDLNGHNTDSIMLASFNENTNKLNVLSIPRDTYIKANRSTKKINAAYSIGKIAQLYEEIESVIGFKPDRYVIVGTQAFVDLIDEIGGVEIEVEQDMKYSDPTQDLYIDIDKGYQTLNGYDSMCFMRFRRYLEGDIGRVRAQQKFVKALMKKVLSLETIATKLPEMSEIIKENVDTNLTVGNIVWLATEVLKMDFEEDLATYIVPGEGDYYEGLSYFFPYENKTLELINEVFNPYEGDIEKVNILDYETVKRSKLQEE